MVKEVSAGAVVFRKNEEIHYLLLHYESGHWDLPKGNVEKNENEKDTAKREIEEETGIKDIKFLEEFNEKISYFYKRKDQTVYKEVIFFAAETKERHVILSYEHIGFKWLNYEDAMKQLTFKTARNLVKKVNERLKQKNLEDF